MEKKFKYDSSTLNGFRFKSSPFFGNQGFFRFLSLKEYKKMLIKKGFKIRYLEKTTRTYNNLKEKFEFIVVEAKKNENRSSWYISCNSDISKPFF